MEVLATASQTRPTAANGRATNDITPRFTQRRPTHSLKLQASRADTSELRVHRKWLICNTIPAFLGRFRGVAAVGWDGFRYQQRRIRRYAAALSESCDDQASAR